MEYNFLEFPEQRTTLRGIQKFSKTDFLTGIFVPFLTFFPQFAEFSVEQSPFRKFNDFQIFSVKTFPKKLRNICRLSEIFGIFGSMESDLFNFFSYMPSKTRLDTSNFGLLVIYNIYTRSCRNMYRLTRLPFLISPALKRNKRTTIPFLLNQEDIAKLIHLLC